jgi:tetratricopeptide (TPR) repeat protein
MAIELTLRFATPRQVIVRLTEDGEPTETEALPFQSPLHAADQRELQWYLEVYPTQYTTEVDDARAARIADQLSRWGAALFTAVFQHPAAARLIHRFQDRAEVGRLLTINSEHPTVLGQPWELLRDPTGTYLFLEQPRISVRRRLAGAGGGRRPFDVTAKDQLHLLVVVSRPTNTPFIDPRADPQAVLDALEAEVPGRVTVEFLRPATLLHLLTRLEDKRRPVVDIVHFDGHGIYDPDGRLSAQATRGQVPAGLSDLIRQDAGGTGAQGYLLFEEEDSTAVYISATLLGEALHRQHIGLVVLSACQSAMVGGNDPMGSVAARLTHAGLPAVLAMTHTVLVPTTRALFGHFYRELARGHAVATALDNARRALYLDPARGMRPRGTGRITLRLQDWFVPALYQAGRDTALLTEAPMATRTPARWGNLASVQESGFHGRRDELWAIERAFVGGTRRLVVHGFGGQGKTALAEEAGRWLCRTGMFARACFVGYANFQGVDPVGLAVSTLATVLDRPLLDANAATTAFAETPTLLILDNIEALAEEPQRELLDAAAAWSEAGNSRVLLTTRQPDFGHLAYPVRESQRCRYLRIEGLDPEDALAWFQAIMQLPPAPRVPLPTREALRVLFAKIDFHPLSVGVLARELKERRVAELGKRLEALLQETDSPLLASLTLSLERLAPESQPWLLRLGVFRGGTFERNILDVTSLREEQWGLLRRGLEHTGLLQVEPVPGVTSPFLRFHPTLAPALWGQLTPDEQARLAACHRKVYYELSFLSLDENKDIYAVRAIVWREFPNLLAAVSGALEAGESWALDFVDNVNWFLNVFGRTRDRAQLTARVQALGNAVGSEPWYLTRSNQGDQLLDAGDYPKATAVFQEILTQLGEPPSDKRSATLGRLAKCYTHQGQPERGEALARQALAETEQLKPFHDIRWRRWRIGQLQGVLGEALQGQGDYGRAQVAYEAFLASAEERGELRSVVDAWCILGILASKLGAWAELERRFQQAFTISQQLHEPAMEANWWLQLGKVHQEAKHWDDAERAYREAARLREHLGDRLGTAQCWHDLATIYHLSSKFDAAEAWYQKALKGFQIAGDRLGESTVLANLADLLERQPGRLTEAYTLAEAARAIKESLDSGVGEIWKIYNTLARIVAQQGKTDEARVFRRQAREAMISFKGTPYVLRPYADYIALVVAAVAHSYLRPPLEELLEGLIIIRGRGPLVAAIRRVLDGERDADALYEALDLEGALVVQVILRCLDNPETLQNVLGGEAEDEVPSEPPTSR